MHLCETPFDRDSKSCQNLNCTTLLIDFSRQRSALELSQPHETSIRFRDPELLYVAWIGELRAKYSVRAQSAQTTASRTSPMPTNYPKSLFVVTQESLPTCCPVCILSKLHRGRIYKRHLQFAQKPPTDLQVLRPFEYFLATSSDLLSTFEQSFHN